MLPDRNNRGGFARHSPLYPREPQATPPDPRVAIEFKGEDQDQREAGAFLIKAFGVALFVMAIILVTQFNGFYQALLMLSAVVFSTVGV